MTMLAGLGWVGWIRDVVSLGAPVQAGKGGGQPRTFCDGSRGVCALVSHLPKKGGCPGGRRMEGIDLYVSMRDKN